MSTNSEKKKKMFVAAATVALALGADAVRGRDPVREDGPRATHTLFEVIRESVAAGRSRAPRHCIACLLPRVFRVCPCMHGPFDRRSERARRTERLGDVAASTGRQRPLSAIQP